MISAEDKAKYMAQEHYIMETLRCLRKTGWLVAKDDSKDSKSEVASCFPALMVSLDIPAEISELCEAMPYKSQDIGIIELLNSFSNLGYIGRPANVRLCDIDERLLPCLFVSEKGNDSQTIVVLRKVSNGEGEDCFSVFDGKTETIKNIDINQKTKGRAYFFAREEDVADYTSADMRKAAGFSWFRALMERFRSIFWDVFALSVIQGCVSLAAPLFVMLVYDRVINAHSPETLSPLVVGAVLALTTEFGIRILRTRSLAWFSARMDNIVNNKIFEHLMLMPPIYTERASVASQIARLKAFEGARDFFNGSLFIAMIEFPFTLIILATIAIIAGPLAIIPVVIAALYVGLLLWMRPKLKVAIRLAAKASSNKQQMTVESFEKIHALRASGMTSSWFRQFNDLSGKASLASFRSGYLSTIIETIAHSLFILAGMSTVVFGTHLIWSGQMTVGALIASMILVWRVLGPLQSFCTFLPRYEQLHNVLSQVNRLMAIKTEHDEIDVTARVEHIKGYVSFSKVGLRYTKDTDPVFAGLSFDAKPGQVVAVTGGNGSGKTTILKLTNALYRPQAGTVRIDGMDIRQLHIMELRRNIAYVPQSPHFFHGTIAENLRFSQPLADDDAIIEVLKQVDAWDDVCELPEGLDTIMGKSTSNISSLLLYRLNLARAFIKNSSLILIDELPYAFLNSSSGESFRDIIKEWKGHRTVIMVTHREDYLKLADIAILLRKGDSPLVADPETVINTINRSNEII